jgi:hypothetical protein
MRLGMACVLLIAAVVATTPPTWAQFSWPYESTPRPTETEPQPSDQKSQPAPSVPPAAKGAGAAQGPVIIGTWKGELAQLGSSTPYKVELAISAKGAESKYPDLNCVGKLTRIGASKSYVFFIEVITKGAASKGGRCPDGTMTMARSGDKLALLWFGEVDKDMIVAYGTLSK